MTKAERWLFTAALNLCAVPITALGIVFQLLPEEIPVINLITQTTTMTSKYNDLAICLFMLVPLGMIIFAALFRYKKLIDKNYMFIVVASMLLSAVFTGVLIYCLTLQTDGQEFIRGIDYSTLVCCVLSIALSCVGTLLYGLKQNEAVGFRNRFTAADSRVWEGVHNILSYIANGLFTALAVLLSFFRGWFVVGAVVVIALVYVFAITQAVSYCYFKRLKAQDEQLKRLLKGDKL